MKSPLDKIAEAAIDIPELARGVCGVVEVEGLDSVRAAQLLFLQGGWKRVAELEGWSKLEHRAYVRKGKKRRNERWLKVTVANFFGVFGIFEVSRQVPY